MFTSSNYFIREHLGFLKLSDTYDIIDPNTMDQIGVAKEKPGALIHILRFFVKKQVLPTKVFVYEGSDPKEEGKVLFSIQRGFTLLRSKVNICDAQGQAVGYLKSKLFSLGGAFFVHDQAGEQVAFVKGNWKGMNYKFTDMNEAEIGRITKEWGGIGKELFTTADNYMVDIGGEPSPTKVLLFLAAGLAIDTVFKEH